MNSNNIPNHLKKYIVSQNYNDYNIIDHYVWSFIMGISVPFFKKHAHSSYLKGLEETGITLDKIPSINQMNKKMSQFGWGVVAVRGFIPPWAFMEFQSLGILPIACDMRSSEHLTYTPAPDIVHESAGHSPIIINKEYSYYLKEYGRIASNAVFSEEDERIYYAIRKLSDIKEDRAATEKEIRQAEQELKNAKANQAQPSEATLLSRLHWWTVEYGLIGSIQNPKIYGAGLLSSVGESQNCLTNNVKKIPFSIDCINYNYDITEQQPQLFVANSFSDLTKVLHEFEKSMIYYKDKNKVNKQNLEDEDEEQISKLNQNKILNIEDKNLINLYKQFDKENIDLKELYNILETSYNEEWLLRFNIYKKVSHLNQAWVNKLKIFLNKFSLGSDLNKAIQRGLELIKTNKE